MESFKDSIVFSSWVCIMCEMLSHTEWKQTEMPVYRGSLRGDSPVPAVAPASHSAPR